MIINENNKYILYHQALIHPINYLKLFNSLKINSKLNSTYFIFSFFFFNIFFFYYSQFKITHCTYAFVVYLVTIKRELMLPFVNASRFTASLNEIHKYTAAHIELIYHTFFVLSPYIPTTTTTTSTNYTYNHHPANSTSKC